MFILEGRSDDHVRILLALALSALAASTAFLIHWITLDGLFASIVYGTVVLGLGGWLIAGLVLLFFITGSILAKDRIVDIKDGSHTKTYSTRFAIRRNGMQVWSNGFWVAVFSVMWFLFQLNIFLVLAAAAMASATADTWATELGTRKKGRTYLITNFTRVDPGTDGGISIKGTLAGIWGSLLIATAYLVISEGFPMPYFSVVAISGFLGCLTDSYLGAIFQYETKNDDHPKTNWFNNQFESHENANNAVNWMSTGIGAFFALLLSQFI